MVSKGSVRPAPSIVKGYVAARRIRLGSYSICASSHVSTWSNGFPFLWTSPDIDWLPKGIEIVSCFLVVSVVEEAIHLYLRTVIERDRLCACRIAWDRTRLLFPAICLWLGLVMLMKGNSSSFGGCCVLWASGAISLAYSVTKFSKWIEREDELT
jgi:hypothetical protein